jgi:hypothetical protein
MATIFILISATCNKISDMRLIAKTGITKEGSKHATAHAATDDDSSCILINYPIGNPAPCLNIIKLLMKDLMC